METVEWWMETVQVVDQVVDHSVHPIIPWVVTQMVESGPMLAVLLAVQMDPVMGTVHTRHLSWLLMMWFEAEVTLWIQQPLMEQPRQVSIPLVWVDIILVDTTIMVMVTLDIIMGIRVYTWPPFM